MQTLIAECKGDMSTNAEFLFIFISKIRLLERTAIFMYANSFEEGMMNTNVIYYYQSAKQTILFFCYWLIFALSYSTMDSGRIGTWNQKHVFHISTLWRNGVFLGQVEPGFCSFFAHIFDMIFRPEEKSSSMYVTKFVWILNKNLTWL